MRGLMELLRILLIFLIFGSLASMLLGQIYSISDTSFQWIGFIGIFVGLFVLYRNRLQFSGWYKGKSRHRPPESVSTLLVLCSVVLMIAPFILGLLYTKQ